MGRSARVMGVWCLLASASCATAGAGGGGAPLVDGVPEHPPGIWSDRYVSPSAYAHAIEAVAHWESGRLSEAASHADLALSFDPESVSLRLTLAEIHLEMGEVERAEERLGEALERDPGSARAQAVAARVALRRGEAAEAARLYRRAVSMDPGDVEGRRGLAEALAAAGDAAGAGEALEAVLAARPGDVEALLGLGESELGRGMAAEARGRFERAVSLRPEEGAGYLGLSRALASLGLEGEAAEMARRCAQLAGSGRAACWAQRIALLGDQEARAAARALSQEPGVAEGLADRLLEAGRGEALVWLAEGLSGGAGGDLWGRVGRYYEGEGSALEAARAYGRVLKGGAGYVEGQSRRGALLGELGRWREAVEAAEAAVEAAPGRAEGYLLLAALWERQGKVLKGLKVLEEGVRALPGDVGLLYRLAVLAREAGQGERALEALEAVVRLDGRHGGGLGLLGVVVAESGRDPARAEGLLRGALEVEGERADLLGALGGVLILRGKYDEALSRLERAASMSPGSAQILSRLGDARRADGQIEGALEVWGRALEMTSDKGLRVELMAKIRALSLGGVE